jgi:TolB-like protein/Tfp pilus assembly protein PilF
VLPFVNMSEDPKQEYFSDGITEDITSDLSRISSLFVIARNSAFTYKNKAVKVQEVSKELGVRYVLEGSVRRAEDQVRITTQLIDATKGYHLWSERYDHPLKDLFALQDEIVRQIVANLRVEVQEAELERVRRIPTENLTAYDLALRGRELLSRAWDETSKEANAQAQQLYEQAIKLDPLYAQAYEGLSSSYYAEFFYHWGTMPTQSLIQAEELARQAIQLDRSLTIAHRTLSAVALFKKQHDQAVAEAEQAVTLDPNADESYDTLGAVQFFVGRPEEGIKLIEKAMRLNPRYPPLYIFHLSCAYRVAERYVEALKLGKKAAALMPDFGPAHWNLTVIYSELDRLEEARAELAEVLRLQPAMSLEWVRQNLPYKDPVVLERHLAALRKAGLK